MAPTVKRRDRQGSRQVMLENAGHFLHLEQPQAAIREILSFLDTA